MTFPVSDIIRKIMLTAAKTRVDCRLGKPNFKGQFLSDDASFYHTFIQQFLHKNLTIFYMEARG